MADVTAECMSERVEAVTRATKVEALKLWSACRMRATSNQRVSSGRHLAGEHVEEIRGKVELWVRRDGVLTVANSSKRRCDGADLAGEAQRLALVRLN